MFTNPRSLFYRTMKRGHKRKKGGSKTDGMTKLMNYIGIGFDVDVFDANCSIRAGVENALNGLNKDKRKAIDYLMGYLASISINVDSVPSLLFGMVGSTQKHINIVRDGLKDNGMPRDLADHIAKNFTMVIFGESRQIRAAGTLSGDNPLSMNLSVGIPNNK